MVVFKLNCTSLIQITRSISYSLIYGCPATCLNIAISCLVASKEDPSFESGQLKSMIFAAYSLPVSFSMHLLTVDEIPL